MLNGFAAAIVLFPFPHQPRVVMAPIPPAAAGEAVIHAAYDKYAGRWFRTATLIQRNTHGDRVETWYEAMELPGRLRVDVAPYTTGRAIIYHGDTVFAFGAGKPRPVQHDPNLLFLLTGGLHTQPPERTIAALRPFFDLSRTSVATWQGRPVIVVGAFAGDSNSNQFWLDKERLILVRLRMANAADRSRPLDARVSDYEQAAGGWLEREIRIYEGRTLTQSETNTAVKVDVALEPGLFDPRSYFLPKWTNGANDVFGGMPAIPLPTKHP